MLKMQLKCFNKVVCFMDYKKLILQIIRDNQPLGMPTLDRLFHDKVDVGISCVPVVIELENEGLILTNQCKLTKKGEEYLKKY